MSSDRVLDGRDEKTDTGTDGTSLETLLDGGLGVIDGILCSGHDYDGKSGEERMNCSDEFKQTEGRIAISLFVEICED